MKKKWLFAVLLILLLIITLLRFDAENLFSSIKQIPLRLVALLIGLQIVSQLLVNILWLQITKFTHVSISFMQMLYVNCQGAVIDSITPGVKIGGEVTRAVQIKRITDCSGEEAAAIVALQKLFSMSALFFILLFSVGYLIGEAPMFQAKYVQFFTYGILLFFLFLFLGIFLFPHRIRVFLQKRKTPRYAWTTKVRSFLFTLLDRTAQIRKNTGACILLFLLSLLIWLIYPVKLYILAANVFPEAQIMYIAAVTFVSYMVAMLPIFPGGLGGFEGTMSGLLIAHGFLISEAAVITVLFRFITFWFVMLASLVFIGLYKIKNPRREQRGIKPS